MIRLFAALSLDDEAAAGLVRRQVGLEGARWRPREALHVTLRFFGELRNDTAADLDAELEQVRAPSFDIALRGAGAFGERDRMRAVWAGVEASPALAHLAARCEAAARRAGLEPETRAFRPHVTLAYLNRAAPAPKVAAWVQANNLLRSAPMRVEAFGLFSSWASAEGSRYDLERTYALRLQPQSREPSAA